jgi:hypothetical protein
VKLLTSAIALFCKFFGITDQPFFDPDTTVFSFDKLDHAVGGTAIAIFLGALGFSAVGVLLGAAFVGAVFELGQWDTARNLDIKFAPPGATPESPLGHAGFGFGLLDIAAGVAGAAVLVGLRLLA